MRNNYRLEHTLYTVIQCTWALPQNLLAGLACLVLFILNPNRKRGRYHGAFLIHWRLKFSMGLGMFIFYGHADRELPVRDQVLVHEFGHTIQSCMLGPLFVLVIGIPSLVWACTPAFGRMRKEKEAKYSDFYPEKWANIEGERVLHADAPPGPDQHMLLHPLQASFCSGVLFYSSEGY